MGKFLTLTKWSAKLGLVGGAVYLAGRESFFGTQAETSTAYNRLKSAASAASASEYRRMLPEAPPVPLPSLPPEVAEKVPDLSADAVAGYRRDFRRRWNSWVVFAFAKVGDLPEAARRQSSAAVDYLRQAAAPADTPPSAPQEKDEKEEDKEGTK